MLHKKLALSSAILQQEIGFKLSLVTAQDMGIFECQTSNMLWKSVKSFLPVFDDLNWGLFDSHILYKINPKSASCPKMNTPGPK